MVTGELEVTEADLTSGVQLEIVGRMHNQILGTLKVKLVHLTRVVVPSEHYCSRARTLLIFHTSQWYQDSSLLLKQHLQSTVSFMDISHVF